MILGIDAGTTSVKTVLYNDDYEAVASGTEEYPAPVPHIPIGLKQIRISIGGH